MFTFIVKCANYDPLINSALEVSKKTSETIRENIVSGTYCDCENHCCDELWYNAVFFR